MIDQEDEVSMFETTSFTITNVQNQLLQIYQLRCYGFLPRYEFFL